MPTDIDTIDVGEEVQNGDDCDDDEFELGFARFDS